MVQVISRIKDLQDYIGGQKADIQASDEAQKLKTSIAVFQDTLQLDQYPAPASILREIRPTEVHNQNLLPQKFYLKSLCRNKQRKITSRNIMIFLIA